MAAPRCSPKPHFDHSGYSGDVFFGLDYTGATRTTPVSSVFLMCVSRVSSCFSVGEISSVRSGDLRSNGAEMQALSALSCGTGSVVAMFAVFPAAGVVGQHVWHFFFHQASTLLLIDPDM